jgi:hypothetical protein
VTDLLAWRTELLAAMLLVVAVLGIVTAPSRERRRKDSKQ